MTESPSIGATSLSEVAGDRLKTGGNVRVSNNLAELINDLGVGIFTQVAPFEQALRNAMQAEQSTFVVNEESVAGGLVAIIRKLTEGAGSNVENSGKAGVTVTSDGKGSASAGSSSGLKTCCIEHYVEAVSNVEPLLAWLEVFHALGRQLGDWLHTNNCVDVVLNEVVWLHLLLAWQQANFASRRAQDLANGNQMVPLDSVARIVPNRFVAPPITMLPTTSGNPPQLRVLTSYAAFLVSHDRSYISTLVPQTLLEAPVSPGLIDLAQVLFSYHRQEIMDLHMLSPQEFCKYRLGPLSRESKLFAVKVGVFLNEKLQALRQHTLDGRQSESVNTLLDGQSACLYCDTLLTYAEAMRGKAGNPFDDPRILSHFEKLRVLLCEVFPEEAAQAGTTRKSFLIRRGSETDEFNDTEAESSEDQIFAAYYRGDLSSSQLVDFMFKLAHFPSGTAESELLARMLRTLFIECRHFPKYPCQELYRTGEFFGKLIRSELLLKRPELHLLAFRCAMEALRKDPSTNIFKFGLVVLQGFLPIAPCSPAFLSALTKMPHLPELFPLLIWYAETCLQAMPPHMQTMSLVEAGQLVSAIAPNQLPSPQGVLVIPPSLFLVPQQATDPANLPSRGSEQPTYQHFGNVAVPASDAQQMVNLQGFGLGQVEALLEDPQITSWIATPPEHIRCRVSQICNTVVRTDVEEKARMLTESLQTEWLPWVAFYIVKSRATKEVNHLALYADFANFLGGPKLIEMIVNVTYDCINVLMKYSVSAKEAASYKTVLKSLGLWLGMLTIGRNKPLKAKCFDCKHLIYSAYECGTLSAVLPMVCACLSNLKHSRVFQPPNPWAMSCLSTLAQLYSLPHCRQKHQFEIELLFRNLGLDLGQYVSGAQCQPNVFETLKCSGDVADTPVPRGPSEPINELSKEQPRAQLLNALAKSAKIPAGLALFHRYPELRIAVPIAMERAVKELVAVMSERAVVLAVGTTVELVLKDFALETEETLVKRAAHLMAAALAGSIVMVTGRPSLRNAIANQFRGLVHSVHSINHDVGREHRDSTVEQAALVIAHENAHVASTLIEQVVIEQSVRAVQEALSQSLASRRAAAEKGELFRDQNFFGPGCTWPAALPPALQITPTLDSKLLEVYKGFAHVGPLKRVRDTVVSEPEKPSGVVPEALSTIGTSVGKMKEAVKALMARPQNAELRVKVPEASPTTIKLLATLPYNNEIFEEINNVVSAVQKCESRETVALCTARRLLRSIYDAAHRGLSLATQGDDVVEISYIYLETFVALLSRFDQLQLVHNLREVVTIWLISASYLTPGTPHQKEKAISYLTMSTEVAARSLIVLHAAAKYDMIDAAIVDADFVSALLLQTWDGLSATANEQIVEAAASTIEFAIQVTYILIVELRKTTRDKMQATIAQLAKYLSLSHHNAGAFAHPSLTQLWITTIAPQPTKFKFSLYQAITTHNRPHTIVGALEQLFDDLNNPPPLPDHCLTMHDLIHLYNE